MWSGINHTQFGACHGQRGDQPASLSDDETHCRLAADVVPWFVDHSEASRPAVTNANSLP
ncbi:hypothetical protein CYV19_11600 [Natronobacterium gregoryi SP2]|uniref:Uncharacterized protein n=1 Tax=Natronobacterium gregoryi (strain ATCC 43098 / DSM 3393 / CCM 3738 / CIP 104747 / IAM 13177 / JCM 8860 / NBRC 102187 / NCIMB 2189 / SP2) TaxID=797304 RepID=A0A2J4JDU2_NATGS|nr:hypothetical protein CYV19_11600 [Natronobacterium gregoryi SP2]